MGSNIYQDSTERNKDKETDKKPRPDTEKSMEIHNDLPSIKAENEEEE